MFKELKRIADSLELLVTRLADISRHYCANNPIPIADNSRHCFNCNTSYTPSKNLSFCDSCEKLAQSGTPMRSYR